MTKKKISKLGAIGGSGDQHLKTNEPRITEYERLRLERIKENMSKMQELGLKDKAMSLMAIVRNSRCNCSKHKMNNISAEDGLYRPNQDTDMELELDSSDEESFIPHSKSNLKSRTIPWKKRRQKVHLASSHGGSSTSQQLVETLGSEVEHLNQNKNDKENEFGLGEKDKPRRGPTMCYNVHGRSEEEHLGITLNEHGQPVSHHDDKTCNEFTSFLGTIARKPNILPLTVKNWPILRNKKKELWDYVLEVEKKHDKEVEAMQKNFEDKRQQDRREMANGLRSFFSQLQQQNPQMSFDLDMFDSLFFDSKSKKDGNSTKMLQLHSLASTSKGLNSMESEQKEDEEGRK